MKNICDDSKKSKKSGSDRFSVGNINEEQFNVVSEIFKCLGDPTRVKIFWILSHREECVSGISDMLSISSPAVSHHIHSLITCGLVSGRRKGKETYYKITDREESRLLHKTAEAIMEITCPQDKVDIKATPEEIVNIVHEHLLDHLDVRTTIEELSHEFLINPTTLKKAFKEVYGTSIAAHMNEHRMEKAAKLLVSTNESISEIALSVGYESQSRFTNVFEKTYTLPPSEYRKKYKKI